MLYPQLPAEAKCNFFYPGEYIEKGSISYTYVGAEIHVREPDRKNGYVVIPDGWSRLAVVREFFRGARYLFHVGLCFLFTGRHDWRKPWPRRRRS